MDQKLSLCVPTYERFDMVNECISDLLDDVRVDDIILMDDDSTDGSAARLEALFDFHPKVKVKRQTYNVGMSVNKRDAVRQAKNEWCILIDDDNVVTKKYVDALFSLPDVFAYENEIFLPESGDGPLDYSEFSEKAIFIKNLKDFVDHPKFGMLTNTCNFVVNRDYYMKTFVPNPEMRGTDSAWHFLQHLKSGGSFYVVPGMKYYHRIHSGSGFMKDVDYNMAKAKEIENLIRAL